MKRVLFLVATLLSVSILQAKVIKPNDAMTFAKTFCEKVISQPEVMNQNWKLAYTECSAKDKEVNAVYVFNKPQNNGFVVIAADDIVPNMVLGYSDNGAFDYNKMPDGLKWLLSMYSKQIDNLKAQGKNYTNVQATATKDSIIIPPLMGNVLWNQGDPYNRLCPAGCPVGCVATATTALMYFHKWPLTGTGSKTYKENGRTHIVDFSKSNYQWQNILPRYRGSFTTAQADAISKLSFDCGVSVEMNYTSSGSGAHNNDVKTALTTYFKYNSDVEYKRCGSMSRDDWNTFLKNELNAMRPLLYGGQGLGGGHAFICDGYTKNEYFHFNFGWSGNGNGYYLSSLDDQNAMESETDFSMAQDIVCNLHPGNKHFVDGLYYHILSADEVEVCTPESSFDYIGNIVIPNIVKINDKEYTVTRIGCAAFGNCKEITSLTLPESIEIIEGNFAFGCIKLDSLFVPWSKPLDVYSTTFFNDFTSKTVLVVPTGSIKSYSAAEGWNQFAKIADGQTSNAEWTEWKPFESGYCKYVQNSMFKTTYNLNIYQRALVSDMTKVQLKVKDFGQFSALDLIINWDKQTNECQVEKQNYGYYDDKYGDSYVSDMPHYNSSYTYKSYPCKFNSETGIFELNLVYFCDEGIYGNATDSLILTEAPKPEWTEWEECGTAEYTHGLFGEELQEDIVAYKRTYIPNPDIFEYKFEGWGTGYWSESGTDLIVHINADGTIAVNEQDTGGREVDSSTGEELPIYVTDVVSFNKNTFSPKYCSSTFDAATKTGLIWPIYYWYLAPESSSVTGYFGMYPNDAGGFDKNFSDTFVIHEATGGLKGDANDDGSVNVNDISTIAAYILEDSPQPFVFENADVNDDGVVNVNDISATATIILDGEGDNVDGGSQAYLKCPDDNHPHIIDLGLQSGTKWCCCNVGATTPEAYGGYYAWGETSEKDVYSKNTYVHYNNFTENYTNIGSDIAGSRYDVAHVNMGASWCMPSLEQQKELTDNCTKIWTTQNGVDGILVIGKNGGQIFLPAAGYRWNNGLSDMGSSGFYWSSSIYQGYDGISYFLYFDSADWDKGNNYRFDGRSVRAVCP